MRYQILVYGFVFFLVGSCEDGSHEHHEHHEMGDEHSEHGDENTDGTPLDTDTYVANLKKTSLNGHFTITLVESTPIPKDIGKYDWHLSIADANGEPINNAEVIAEPLMPAHGHGTQPPFTAGEITEENGYFLSQMYLYMPGEWEVMIRIKSEEGLEDEVSYLFELDG